MDRTQKKCFVGVTVMHALPLLIAVIGTAFFNKDEKISESPHIIELINPNVTDGPTRGGAQAAITISVPDAKPLEAIQPKPTPPAPQPEPPKETFVEQPKPKPAEPKEDVSEIPVPTKKTLPKPVSVPKTTEKVAAKPEPTKRKIDISKPTIRNTSDKKAAADAADKAARDAATRARNQIAAQIKGTANRLGQNLSSSTTIEMSGASGDAGAINYRDLVMKRYDEAWSAPNDVEDAEANTKVRVVIARNGNIISSEIIDASGNAKLDASVRRTLNGLRRIEPFPAGSKDSQRIFIINFNLKARRGIG